LTKLFILDMVLDRALHR